jgi:hypothetical protein
MIDADVLAAALRRRVSGTDDEIRRLAESLITDGPLADRLATGEARDRDLIARHLRAAASAINITDWPAYLNRCADLHATGEA